MISEAAIVEAIQPIYALVGRLVQPFVEMTRRISHVETSIDNIVGWARRISRVETSIDNIIGLARRISRVETSIDNFAGLTDDVQEAKEANEALLPIIWAYHSRISELENVLLDNESVAATDTTGSLMTLRGYDRIRHNLRQSQNEARRQQVSRRRNASSVQMVSAAALSAPFEFGGAPALSAPFAFGGAASSELFVFGDTPTDANMDNV